MTGRRWTILAAAAGPLWGTAGLVALVLLVTAGAAPAAGTTPPPATPGEVDVCVTDPGAASASALSTEQLGNAAVIVGVARHRRLGLSGAVLGVMAALTESSLINIDRGDRLGPDSRGLFQQRDSWGPLSVRMDPAGAAGLFYDALQRLPGWRGMPPWAAAQAVQQSEFGDGSNYRVNYQTALAAAQSILGASGSCPPAPPSAGGVPIAAAGGGSVGVSNGAWGGFSDGLIPASALCPLSAPGQFLRCDAASAWNRMAAAYRADTGEPLCVTDSYRDLAAQQELYVQKPGLAAVPGTSNHGWGLAVDLCEPGTRPMGYTTPAYRWLKADAAGYGWVHPGWADPGRGREEPWHWEYTGTSR